MRKLSVVAVALIAGASSLGLLATSAHAATKPGVISGSETCHVTGVMKVNHPPVSSIKGHLLAFGTCTGTAANVPAGKHINAASVDMHLQLQHTNCDGLAALPIDVTKQVETHIVWENQLHGGKTVHYNTAGASNARSAAHAFASAGDIPSTSVAGAFAGETITVSMDSGSVVVDCAHGTISLSATVLVG